MYFCPMPTLEPVRVVTPNGIIQIEPYKLLADKSLYAIYGYIEGKAFCFHMRLIDGTYKIIDKHRCPYDLQEFESGFSLSILNLED